MRTLFVIAFLCVSSALYATTPGDSARVKKFRYYFTLGSGSLFCSSCSYGNNVSAAPWMTYGVQYRERWRFGAGLAFNSLGPTATLPYFASVGYDLFGKKNKVFAELNGGSALARTKNINMWGLVSEKGTGHLQAVLGYSFRVNRMRFDLRSGYQYTRIVTKYKYGEGGLLYPTLSSAPISYPGDTDVITWAAKRFFIGMSFGI